MFYFLHGYDAGITVLGQIHRLPGISVDMAIEIIRTSVSCMNNFQMNVINAVHEASFWYQLLLDCNQDLQLIRRIINLYAKALLNKNNI